MFRVLQHCRIRNLQTSITRSYTRVMRLLVAIGDSAEKEVIQ